MPTWEGSAVRITSADPISSMVGRRPLAFDQVVTSNIFKRRRMNQFFAASARVDFPAPSKPSIVMKCDPIIGEESIAVMFFFKNFFPFVQVEFREEGVAVDGLMDAGYF